MKEKRNIEDLSKSSRPYAANETETGGAALGTTRWCLRKTTPRSAKGNASQPDTWID